jgi:hypothetical protein
MQYSIPNKNYWKRFFRGGVGWKKKDYLLASASIDGLSSNWF